MSCESNCGQPTIEWSPGCYTANSSTTSSTIDIYRTFMPDPVNLGKTILTETRYVMATAAGPTPFVPNFAGGDTVAPGACPLSTIVTSIVATGDMQNACYNNGTAVVPIKIVTEVAPNGTLTVLAFSLPTLAPIVGFDPSALVACPAPACPTPTNTGINSSW